MMVVADLLGRVAERRGLQALIAYVGNLEVPGIRAALGGACEALGIQGPAAVATSEEGLPPPYEPPADVHIVGAHLTSEPAPQAIRLTVGGCHIDRQDDEVAFAAEIMQAAGSTPLAVKFAMMSVAHYELADASFDALERARMTILDWQRLVAGWAEFPSRPVPPDIAARIREYFERLDTPAVIRLLSELAGREDIAPGAKFETFIYADQILALDLERSIGQLDR